MKIATGLGSSGKKSLELYFGNLVWAGVHSDFLLQIAPSVLCVVGNKIGSIACELFVKAAPQPAAARKFMARTRCCPEGQRYIQFQTIWPDVEGGAFSDEGSRGLFVTWQPDRTKHSEGKSKMLP